MKFVALAIWWVIAGKGKQFPSFIIDLAQKEAAGQKEILSFYSREWEFSWDAIEV